MKERACHEEHQLKHLDPRPPTHPSVHPSPAYTLTYLSTHPPTYPFIRLLAHTSTDTLIHLPTRPSMVDSATSRYQEACEENHQTLYTEAISREQEAA